jgi:phosphoglycolate phosphatase
MGTELEGTTPSGARSFWSLAKTPFLKLVGDHPSYYLDRHFDLSLSRISGSEDPEVLVPLIDAFKAHYDSEGCKSVSVFPGVEDMLARLGAAEITLHIATNKRRTPTLAILDHLGWTGRFDSVFSSDMYPRAFATKADMLRRQLRERSLAISSTAYVGDRMEDGHAAGANGLLFYLAAWGYDVVASPQVLPSWVRVGNPSEIP